MTSFTVLSTISGDKLCERCAADRCCDDDTLILGCGFEFEFQSFFLCPNKINLDDPWRLNFDCF